MRSIRFTEKYQHDHIILARKETKIPFSERTLGIHKARFAKSSYNLTETIRYECVYIYIYISVWEKKMYMDTALIYPPVGLRGGEAPHKKNIEKNLRQNFFSKDFLTFFLLLNKFFFLLKIVWNVCKKMFLWNQTNKYFWIFFYDFQKLFFVLKCSETYAIFFTTSEEGRGVCISLIGKKPVRTLN